MAERGHRLQSAPTCELTGGGESTITAITSPFLIHLADGRYVRLAEIILPTRVAGTITFDPEEAILKRLREIAVGQHVEIKFGAGQRDRYGIYTAHVYVKGEPELWLQEELVSHGFARVLPQPDNRACASKLLKAEDAARQGGRGYWGSAYFKILPANDRRLLFDLAQTYQIVEGDVATAREKSGRLILGFSKKEGEGFEAVVEAAARKTLKLDGNNSVVGAHLRLRGWLDRHRQPFMAISLAEQIEVISLPAHGN
jgi:hypothetical protein